MMREKKTGNIFGGILLAAGLLFTVPAYGEDVPEGTVINAQNLKSLLDKTFEGETIQSLIPKNFQWQIREKGLTMKLAHTKPHPKDPKWVAAAERNREAVTLDDANLLNGWEAGPPFPAIDLQDPKAGRKVMWNMYLGKQRGDNQEFPDVVIAMINGKTGLERVQKQFFKRSFARGALRRDNGASENKRIIEKSLVVQTSPQDLKGNGLVLIRYLNGDPDWLLAYAVAARKVRRFSGDFWMDKLGSTDYLADDVLVLSAHPTWYADFKIIAKKKILVVANSAEPFWKKDGDTPQERFPVFDLKKAPYWNPVDEWEPREVYVIEGTTPERHPYSRKVLYVDAEQWTPYLGEYFTPKGKLWKTTIQGHHVFPIEDDPEGNVLWGTWSVLSDFLVDHASVLITSKDTKFNTDLKPSEVNLKAVKKAKW